MNNNQNTKNTYWFQDFNLLVDMDKLDKLYPTKQMTRSEKVNSLVRLSIIVGIILSLFNRNSNWLIIPVGFMILTYVMYLFRMEQDNEKMKKAEFGMTNTKKELSPELIEKFECMKQDKYCSEISESNPFMNPMPFDKRTRPPACDVLSKKIQAKINNTYGKGVYHDSSDIFRGNDGLRQFYTTASTTYPNNRDNFAKWLYGTPPTCKEGNGNQCVANLYHPIQRRLFAPGHASSP